MKGYKLSQDIEDSMKLFGRDVGEMRTRMVNSPNFDRIPENYFYSPVPNAEESVSDFQEYLKKLTQGAKMAKTNASRCADELGETASNLESAAKIKRKEANKFVEISTRRKKIMKWISEVCKGEGTVAK